MVKNDLSTWANEGKGTDLIVIGWKQGFRAGKELPDPARAFVIKGMRELK